MTNSSLSIWDIFAVRGKTLIITGGTGGIGLTLALALAEAGADIVSIQIPDDPSGPALKSAIEGLGRKFSAFDCNIADATSIRSAFTAIWEAGVVPDILLNCAGVSRRGPIAEFAEEHIDLILAINLKGAYVVSQEFGKQLLKLGRPGKIIHMCSMAAYSAQTNVSIYATSKAGVLQLTKALSNEWASKGIQCNCISPGFIKTPLTKALWSDPAFYAKSIERTPAGRWGTPDDLKGVVIFLASGASDFVTGQSIIVDGGILGF